jgi:cell division septal protein FtsQ
MRANKYRFLLRRYLPLAKTLFIVIAVVAIVWFLFRTVTQSDRFVIKSYSQTGIVKFVNAGDFEKVVTANVIGQNIFKLDTALLEDSLKKSFQGISTIKISKKYFDKLIIQIQERVPLAIVVDKNGVRYLIDLDGYVLGAVEDSYFDLPSLNYDQELHVGQFVDSKIVPVSMEIINQAKIESVSVSSVSFKPEYSMFYASNSVPVYMNNDENIKDSLKIVSRLLAKAALENKSVAKIDLRYDKVIVLYN